MPLYLVEGQVRVDIDLEIEANSFKEAEELAKAQVKENLIFPSGFDLVDDFTDLHAGKYEDEDYSGSEDEDEDEEEQSIINEALLNQNNNESKIEE